MKVPREGIGKTDEGARSLVIDGVASDVAQIQIEQAVVVVVEEDRTRRVADMVDASRLRNVREMAFPVVFEEDVSLADSADEQVLIAVVVDVGERGRDADPVSQRDTGLSRDIHESTTAEILPKLTAAPLIHKIDIGQSVAVHIGCSDAAAVVVVNELVIESRVVDDPVREGDAAGLHAIHELKLVEDPELADGLTLRACTIGKTFDADVRIGNANTHGWRLSGLGPAPLPFPGWLTVSLAKARNSGIRRQDREDNDDRHQARRSVHR